MTKKNPDNKKAPKVASKRKSPSTKELNESLKLEKEKYVRLFAEFENYKRRTAKERIELFKTAKNSLAKSLILLKIPHEGTELALLRLLG